MAIVLYSCLAGAVELIDAHNNRGTYTSGCNVPVEEAGSVRMRAAAKHVVDGAAVDAAWRRRASNLGQAKRVRAERSEFNGAAHKAGE